MAEFTPTPSQKQAIEDRGGALLVSAAAGSGKTRVLTERLMSRVCDPDDPKSIDSFLVITFSKAAAAELRGRIADELAERVAQNPGSKRLRRQNALVSRAQISTIHGFCTSLLREHCHLLGLPPDFAVADEDRARELRRIALDRVMDSAYAQRDEAFLLLVDTVGAGRDDKRLAELVMRMHDKLQSHARPALWAERQIEELKLQHEDAGQTPWGRELLDYARSQAEYWAREMDAMLAIMNDYDYIMKAYGSSVSETVSCLHALFSGADEGWEAVRACLPVAFPRLGSLRNPPDVEVVELIKARRDACKKAMGKLATDFSESSEKLLCDMSRTAPAMEALLGLTLDFNRQYTKEKRRRALVDFSDLEHLAAELLTDETDEPSELAHELSGRYTEVMIDEYQDVSRVQDLIIKAISREGVNLFMVGDVKQSIYRFRLADPTIFLEKYNSYADAADAAPGEPRRVFLRESFRSRPEVVSAVNAVFTNVMSTELGELEYDENAALRAGLPYEGTVPIPELIAVALPDGDDETERPDKIACEAAAVAVRIRQLIESGALVDDRGASRPVGYGDVAILLRSVNVSGRIYKRELARAGVPVKSDLAGGFFSAPEISVMLSLLAVIDNPRQDVPLIAVLRSELFGFTPDELSAIRAVERKGEFWDALISRGDEDEKCRAFLYTLEALRDFSRDAELAALLREVYSRLDCMALCCALDDGQQRRGNLMLLYELAKQFEQTGWRGLRRFLIWLRSMSERGQEPGVGGSVQGGAVQIMSIHKSKGLEFPAVFLCDTARRFNRSDSRENVLVHPVLGLGPKLTDTERGIEYPTLARNAIARRMERETLSEELRLLYVAMTRARERLFISCVLPDPEKTIAKLRQGVASPMPASPLLAMQAPAHWLISAALADEEQNLRLVVIRGDTDAQKESVKLNEDEVVSEINSDYVNLSETLSWRYPFPTAQALPSKLTATEIKSIGEDDPEAASILPRAARIFRKPDLDATPRGLTAAERGTATHLALRYIDFAAAKSRGVAAELERLTELGRLSSREAEAVNGANIERLLESDLGKRILSADKLMRELAFTLLCPSELIFPGSGDEELLLQGVVDCCIEEDGELLIIDYKTDAVSADDVSERAEQYRAQVKAYAYAMQRLSGKPVRGSIIYFLRPGIALEIE